MTKKTGTDKPADSAKSREDRLKAALKANMAKRKSQARARSGSKTETANNKG